MVFQIFLVIFAAFAMFRTFRQYREGQVSRYWLVLMLVVWLAVAIVAIVPHWTDIIADVVGVGRGADLLVYLAIIILLWGYHRVLVRQHQMSQELTALVRHFAIKDAQEEQRNV